MFCHKCGVELPDDSRFCRKCGQAQSVLAGGGAAVALALIPEENFHPRCNAAKRTQVLTAVLPN
jgi:uncharacterized membrane protein YvbJ